MANFHFMPLFATKLTNSLDSSRGIADFDCGYFVDELG